MLRSILLFLDFTQMSNYSPSLLQLFLFLNSRLISFFGYFSDTGIRMKSRWGGVIQNF